MHSLSWVRSAAAVISDATPLGGPSTGSGDVSISTVVRLSLTELEPLARPRPARLLPLDDPRIARQQDRKSTRLNSSHSQISYAVFCLKKKKTKQALPCTASEKLLNVVGLIDTTARANTEDTRANSGTAFP